MAIEVKVPILPESVADATVAAWHKKPGEAVSRDENLVDIETDKVMLEVPAPEDGVLQEIVQADGATVVGEQVLAIIETGAAVSAAKSAVTASSAPATAELAAELHLSPAVRRLVEEHNIDVQQLLGSGKDGKITKQDVLDFISNTASNKTSSPSPAAAPAAMASSQVMASGARSEKRVPMSRLRKRIAERLVESQQNAAILTTFNEVDLLPVMQIRKRYQEQFQKVHDIKLGFMSFFIKASIEALKRFPLVNASIDGDDVIYHGYFDVGVAVSTERGLVVPVIRNADQMSLAALEKKVVEYGCKARDGQLTIEEMTGGTFTVSNGGVFGSLISTPIINPPQSGILGMHKIQERPVVVNGEIVIRPMMYIALSYDHRIIDGKDSVSFLKAIKEVLEDPTRILLDL